MSGFLIVHTVGPQKGTSVVHDVNFFAVILVAEVSLQDHNPWVYETVKGNGKVTKHSHTGGKTTVLFLFYFDFTSRQISSSVYAAVFSKGSLRL